MTTSDNAIHGKPVLVLPALLDMTVAAELKRDLQSAYARGEGLDVDAGSVSRVTSPCLQILAAAAQDFAQAGGPGMAFTSLSPAFSETVAGLALSAPLGITETP
ncbi:MAG TPA: STAS domain-containing protein [Rhizomicrobium sp.]